jgi:hydrogenase/urease accessory protein HupE
MLMAFMISPAPSWADLLPAQNATLNLVDSSVFVVVSTPVSALSGVDDNGDGLLSTTERIQHDLAIQKQFTARFHVTDGGTSGNVTGTLVADPNVEGVTAAGPSYVVVLQRINFKTAPTQLTVGTDLFGTNKGEQQITLRATHGKRVEVVMLDSAHTAQRVFIDAWGSFTKFIRIGIEHILGGKDHLLFLLTIMVAAAGWRYWLGVVTSFTIAHSITLTLSVLGVVRVSPQLIEPTIAASIIFMALYTLIRPGSPVRGRIALVFGFGLLHGLGFASALSDMGLDSEHQLATLAGFNVGVEIGQFLFLLAVVALLFVIRRTIPTITMHHWARGTSAVAAILGGMMLAQRLL